MARNRKEKGSNIRLKQPDRSGPDPTQQTLLDLAEQRGLLKIPKEEENEGIEGLDENGEPLIGRLAESIFWALSLTMLHFTLDFLVAHQYAIDIKWHEIVVRTAQTFPGTLPSISSPGQC